MNSNDDYPWRFWGEAHLFPERLRELGFDPEEVRKRNESDIKRLNAQLEQHVRRMKAKGKPVRNPLYIPIP